MSVSSRVLLVDADVDALAKTAAELRKRGLKVSLANGVAMACERAKTSAFDVIVAAESLLHGADGALGLLDALAMDLDPAPPIVLLCAPDAPERKGYVRRDDPEKIAEAIRQGARSVSAPPQASPTQAPARPSILTGMLARLPLGELLNRLARERRTGALSVTTPLGAGEVRLQAGELMDAVYLRLEGSKALARLLGERDGSFTFMPNAPPVMRRITEPTHELLRELEEQASVSTRLRSELAHLTGAALFAADSPQVGPPSGELSALARSVLSRLRTPATLDEVLEDVSAPDPEVLAAIQQLDAAGRIRKLSQSRERVPVCSPDELPVLRALAARSRAIGFSGPARLAFAGTTGRLAVLAHTVSCLAEAVLSAEPTPPVPVPYSMGALALGEDASLELLALPLVPVYAPLWPLVLAGCAAVIRIDEAALVLLKETCAASEIELVESNRLVTRFDEANPGALGGLLRAALELR